VQGSFETLAPLAPQDDTIGELASLAPAGAGGGPSSLDYALRATLGMTGSGNARDDRAAAARADKAAAARANKATAGRADRAGSFGNLRWGNARVTYYAGCAQAQPSEAPFETLAALAPQGDTCR